MSIIWPVKAADYNVPFRDLISPPPVHVVSSGIP
jgi:hypothetical protein